jgi:aromatic-L-amino-acid decarboxylase
MSPEEFARHGHQIVDWIARYMQEAERYPVRSQVAPGDILAQLPAAAPEQGEPMDRILQDFERVIVPGMTHWQHPSFFAYFPANTSGPSILGEMLTAGLGAQCMMWQTSPAATELEERVLDWLRDMLGLPEGWAGVIQDTASTATLCALLTAREAATEFAGNQQGLARCDPPLTVYASEEIHASIPKAVKIAGFGEQSLRLIPTDERLAMQPDRLEQAIETDKRDGLKPACVVACLGTTSTTAFDPLKEIGKIARRHGLWLHVDAAFAGSAAILPEMRWMHEGIELVDSYVFNPHKWLFTNFDLSAYYVADPTALVRTMGMHAEYLTTAVDEQVRNYRDWGVQLGRRFRALRLWFVLRNFGVEGIRARLREHLRLAAMFRDWVKRHPDFELMAPAQLQLVCFRYHPAGVRDEKLDDLNRELLERLNASGKLFLTHTSVRGAFTLRMSIGQTHTEERHVREAWEKIQAEVGGG